MTDNNWDQYKNNNEVVPYFIFQVPGSGKEHAVRAEKALFLPIKE